MELEAWKGGDPLNLPHRGFAVQDDARFDVSAVFANAPAKRSPFAGGQNVVAVAEVLPDRKEASLGFQEATVIPCAAATTERR